MGRKRSNEKGNNEDGQKVHPRATVVNQSVQLLLRAPMPIAMTLHDQCQASLPYGGDHLAYSVRNSGCEPVEDPKRRVVDHSRRAPGTRAGACGQNGAAEATSICFLC
jgi:hypothetical protein